MAAIIAQIAIICLGWMLGYFYLWLMKWMLATFFTDFSIINDAFKAILIRTGADQQESNESSIAGSLVANMEAMGILGGIIVVLYCFSIVGALVVLVLKLRKSYVDNEVESSVSVVPLLLVSLLPYIWFIGASNHSEIHYWFTYRDQIISLFCLCFVRRC